MNGGRFPPEECLYVCMACNIKTDIGYYKVTELIIQREGMVTCLASKCKKGISIDDQQVFIKYKDFL